MREKISKRGIYYKISKGSKEALVFMHGAGSNHTIWLPYIDYFVERRHTVIALDFRGHGKSVSRRIRHNAMEDYVEDVLGILEEENVKGYIPVGLCFGASVGIEMNKRVPANKIVLVNLFDKKTVNLSGLLSIGIKGIAGFLGGMEKIGIRRRNLPYKNYARPKSKSNIYYTLSELRSVNLLGYMKCVDILFNYNIDLRGLDKKVLVVAGKSDLLSNCRKIERVCRKHNVQGKIQYSGVDKAGHFIITRKSPELIKIFERFINAQHNNTNIQ